MKLSVVIISFKSEHLIKKLIINIPKKYQIIVVENSKSKSIKKLEKKFQNVKVLIPNENLGYAKGFNFAYKYCKNNFVLTFTPDVLINNKLIIKLEKFLKKFNNFTLLSPVYKNQKIYKNYTPFSKKKIIKKKFKNFEIQKVKEIDWCFCIINKNKIKAQKILDENYFMYFETIDYCKKLIKKNHKLYIIKDLKFDHLGTSSSKKKYNDEILLNRNWHFSWSKFYFFKKHNNYFYALKKVLPNIYQNLIGVLFSIFKINILQFRLHKASLSGVLNSIFLKKSFYRPNIK